MKNFYLKVISINILIFFLLILLLDLFLGDWFTNSFNLKLNSEIENITDFTMNDIELIGYQSHESIKAPMAV